MSDSAAFAAESYPGLNGNGGVVHVVLSLETVRVSFSPRISILATPPRRCQYESTSMRYRPAFLPTAAIGSDGVEYESDSCAPFGQTPLGIEPMVSS